MSKNLMISYLLLLAWGSACPIAAYTLQNEDANLPKKPSKIETKASAGNPRKRTTATSAPAKRKETVKVVREEARPVLAEFTINVSPGDSTISLGGVEYHAENGTFTRRELQPGKYKVVVSKTGYRDEEYELSLVAGSRTPLSVTLEPAFGTVNISPGVADAAISIVKAETDDEVGRYTGRVSNVELSPGRYQVIVSKSGYQTVIREVTVESAGTIYLEPPLEPLPSPAERRKPERNSFHPDAAMQMQSAPEGKYVVLSLTGRSGSTASAIGSVDVTLSVGGGSSRTGNVSGMLTGFPCQVDFVRLENVAEYAFVEPPGVANQWGRVVIRVRPKDSKRAMHFLINWKMLQSLPANAPP